MNISLQQLRVDLERWQEIATSERARLDSARNELLRAQADLDDAEGMTALLTSLVRRRAESELTPPLVDDLPDPQPVNGVAEEESRRIQTGPAVNGRMADLLTTLWLRADDDWKTQAVYEAMHTRGLMSTGAEDEEAALRPVIHRAIKRGFLDRTARTGAYRLTPIGRLMAEQALQRAERTPEEQYEIA